jgi:uncharacterized membrane protein YeiH
MKPCRKNEKKYMKVRDSIHAFSFTITKVKTNIEERSIMNNFIIIFELIGTVAFSISGALTALDHSMDIFGVIILGVITATGGGVFRDIILGHFPPDAFVNPIYVLFAAVTALIVFLIFYFHVDQKKFINQKHGGRIFLIADAIGLGIFTVMGCETAAHLYSLSNGFLVVFSGVVTGVGGGLLRDMIVSQLPDIFARHIYAIASIIGAIVTLLFYRFHAGYSGTIAGVITITAIRLAAAHWHWSLPRAERKR